MNETHYAFPNSGLLCSHCGWMMDGSSSNHHVRPFDFIVVCPNKTCPHYNIRYKVPAEQGIKLERL